MDGLQAALDYRDYARTRDGAFVEVGAPLREAAVAALAELDSPEALEGLLTALHDPERPVCEAALAALSGRAEPEVVPALARALAHWPADDPAGIDAIWTALASFNQSIGVTPAVVSELLQADGDLPGQGVLIAAALDTSPSRERDEQDVLDLVLEAVRSSDSRRMRRAVRILDSLGGRSVTALLAALEQGPLHPELVVALACTHDRRATAALTPLLGNPDVEVRRAAAHGLAELRDPRAAQALVQASDDDDYEVRTAAVEAVNRLGAVAIIQSIAASTHTDLDSQEAAAELPPASANGLDTPETDETKLRRLSSALRRTR